MTAIDIKFKQVKNYDGDISALFTAIKNEDVVLTFTEKELIDRINTFEKMGICTDEEIIGLKSVNEQKKLELDFLRENRSEVIDCRKNSWFPETISEELEIPVNRVLRILKMVETPEVKDGVCVWLTGTDNGRTYTASCKNKYYPYRINDINNFQYCPFCGEKIKIQDFYDIDTAPRDGSIIIVYDFDWRSWVEATYQSDEDRFLRASYFIDDGDADDFALNAIIGWRPIE